ncbi:MULTISPECIES: DUF4214 domain-containing protein [unclassified Pseudomonas]|uniref:DUF4214 domain-containing protein n=1 Tax=unclassified Pseudomonas TaxID=196821 RepID=UPI0025F10F3D|nr:MULTISPECIES: DUF4214 domain-containing protein [unclassified Pseudomonas]
MADADVQGMLVRIEATTAQLRQEIARGESSVAQAADKIDSSLGRVDKAFDRTEANASVLQKAVSSAFTGIGIAAAASVAGLVAITVKTSEYAQEIKNLAALSNTSVSTFQRLAAGAKTVGIEQDKLSDIFKDTNDRVGEFIQRGGGEMSDFFKEIAPRVGVTAQQFAKLSGPEALQLYYNSLEKAGLTQQQMTTYMEAMADEATGLIPLLKNNGAGFQQFGDQAERTGRILSDFQVDRLVQSNVAFKNLEGSFDGAARQLVVGLLPSIESVTQRLTAMSDDGALETIGSAVGFLVEHFNVLAVVMGGKVAASFAGYLSSLASSTAASVTARTANIAQAASAVEVALANQQAAQTAVVLAEKEAVSARGTAVQTQLSLQLAEARMAERNATAQVAVAQAGLKAASGEVLALLGGPAGLAALAVGAGIAFLTMGGNAKDAGASLEDLKRPIAELRKEFQALTKDQQQATIVTALRQQEQAAGEAGDAYSDFLKTTRQVLGSTVGTRIAGEFETARNSGKGFSDTLDDIQKRFHVPEEGMRSLREAAGQVSTLDVKTGQLKDRVSAYRQEMGATVKPTQDKADADQVANEAANKYLGTLDQQLTKLQDKTAVEQANTFITENKIPVESALSAKIRDRAKAIDAQKEAEKKATEATNAATAATKKAASEEDARKKALADLKAQADIAIQSATGLAAAYLAGVDKTREFTLQQKVEEALLKTGAGARAEVTSKIKAQMDAQDQLAVSKAAYDLGKETSDLLAQAKATLEGTAALEQYNVQKAMQVALAGRNIEVGSQEYQQLLDATQAQQEAIKVAKQASDAGSIIDRLYPSSKLLRDYTQDQDALTKAMELYPERADAYRDALQRLGLEYQHNQASATAWGQFTEGAVDRVDSAFADMWKSILSKSGNFMTTLKDSFRQFLAEMLHMAITKPIIVQFASALGIGGAAAQSTGLFGDAGSAGGGGISSLLNNASSVVSVAGSKFGQAVMSGWSGSDGILGGIQGAFSNGADYLGATITSAFTTGSATASNAAASLAAGASQAGYTGAQFGSWVSSANASSSLSALSSTLSYVGAVYSVISSFQQYGLKGGATTAGFAAAGAAIGSVVPVIGTAIGAAIGAVVGSFASSKLFGSGEKYPDLSTSGQGTYSNGSYSSAGIVQGWQTKAPKYGASIDAQMDATVAKFTSTLGMLYDALGNGADVYAYDMMQVRKTSGKYSTTFGATIDGGGLDDLNIHQQFNAADAAEALQHNYDDIMGTFLAKAIVSSKSLPDYFKAQFTDFANSWDTTADEVIKAIEGVFTRFNGVNDALSLIGVNTLKLDNTGLMASDSILSMIAAMSDLDTTTATAKDKVDALNTAVGNYYSKFYTADEQFADLTKSLKNAFAGLGLNLPDTRTAYRDMVKDIDVTTAAGQAMFATLVGLATNADSYYSTLDQKAQQAQQAQQASLDAQQAAADAAQKITDALMLGANNAFSALQRSISAQQKLVTEAYNARVTSLNDMLSTANTKVTDLTGISNDLGAALKALRGDSDEAVKMLRSQAQATLQSALATARAGGSLANFSGLADALDTVGSNSTDLYSSLEDFNRDQRRTANVVAELNLLNGRQLTNAEKTVKALQDQLDLAKKNYDAQTAQFDAQLAFAQSQLDALDGVGNSILGVTAAINAMNASVVAALAGIGGKATAASPTTNGALVESVYNDVLGRASDAPGKAYWVGQLASGAITYDQLAQAIANAAKGAGQAVKAGYATGGLISGPGTGTSDSILARLSNGEYVMTAAAVQAYGTGLLDQMNALQIPAFATGGPVLDFSAPSQAYRSRSSLSDTSGGDAATVSELRGLRDEMKTNFEYISKYIKLTADHTDDLANRGVQVIGTVDSKAVLA